MPRSSNHTTVAKEGQLDFETRDLGDDNLEEAIAGHLKALLENKSAAKAHNKAKNKLKELLPMDSITKPTRIKVLGGDLGNYLVTVMPQDRAERNAVSAGVSKRIKVETL